MLNLFPQNTDSDAGTRPAPPRRGAGGYGAIDERAEQGRKDGDSLDTSEEDVHNTTGMG